MERVLGGGIIFGFVLSLAYTVILGFIALVVLGGYGIYRLCKYISEQDQKRIEEQAAPSCEVVALLSETTL